MKIGAVILAGGFGTRLQGVLRDLPKPIAPVLGEPFVTWVIRSLRQAGVTRFLLSTGYLAEKISTHFATHPIAGISVQCIPESTPLGTAGGFLNCVHAEPAPPDAWLVANGDSLALTSLRPFIGLMENPAMMPRCSV